MSADRQALLDAMRDEPGNPGLRLIYADWLEDHGEGERVSYIRNRAERSRLGEGDPRAAELDGQAERLWAEHAGEWAKGLPAEVALWLAARGVLLAVETTAEVFLRCADLLRDEPLCSVKLTDAQGHGVALARCAALSTVRALTVAQSVLGVAEQTALASSPRLGRLHTLRLVNCGFRPEGAAALAGSPHLAGLGTLDLGFYERHDEHINNSLWRFPAAVRLTPDAYEIVGEDGLARIGLLGTAPLSEAYWNMIGDAGMEALAASPHLSNVGSLILAHTGLTAAGVRALARSAAFGSLWRLDLSYNYFGPEGMRELVGSPLMPRLSYLELQSCDVGTAGVRALADSASSGPLELLDLSGPSFGVIGERLEASAAEALAASRYLGKLQHLILQHDRIGPEGAAALARSDGLTALQTLYLSGNGIGDAGAAALAASPLVRQIAIFDLIGNDIGDDGALAFACSAMLGDELMTLDLRENPIGPAGAEALAGRFGGRARVSAPDAGETG